jgi:chemotaxis protein CheZ
MTPLDHEALRIIVREELAAPFADLRRFVDRRIAELSAEVHGATQLLGFSESNLSNQLGLMQEEMGRMLARPAEASRNSGLELEAVVQTTEAAANQILEAAEAISDTLRATLPDKQALQAITTKLDAIFEDLTGQRVRRAIEHLQTMETALSTILTPAGQEAAGHHQAPAAGEVELPQDDIDALFAA